MMSKHPPETENQHHRRVELIKRRIEDLNAQARLPKPAA
jgi:hypothetical protein